MERPDIMTWERVIQKILYYLLPVIFILPMYTHSGFFFPFIVPRNLAFRAIVGVGTALFLMLFISRPRAYLPKKNHILYAIGIFLGVLTVSSIINGDFLYSFWSDYERMDGLINLYIVALFIMLLVATYRSMDDWFFIFKFTILVSLPVTFVGWSQHVGADLLLASSGGERLSSTLGNPTYLAAYAMFHMLFALYLFVHSKSSKFTNELILLGFLDLLLIFSEGKFKVLHTIFEYPTLAFFFILPQLFILGTRFLKTDYYKLVSGKCYFGIIILLNFIVLFNTQTRGALVGLIGGFAVILVGLILLQSSKRNVRQYALGGIIVLIILFSSLFYFKNAELVKGNKALNRIASISLEDTTARTRILNWEASFKGWKEKPIFGWGEERYYVVFNKYFPQEIYRHQGSRIWFDRPHNVIIQYFVTGGLLGGLAYLSVFGLSVLALFRHWKRTGELATPLIFTGLIVAYLIQNIFVFDSINTNILYALMIAFIISFTSSSTYSDPLQERRLLKRPLFIIGIIVIGITYGLTVPIVHANKNFISQYVSLTQTLETGNLTLEDISAIENAIELEYFGRYELRQQYSDAIRSFMYSDKLTKEQKIELVKSAEKLMLRSIDEQPDNVRNHAFLSGLYVESQAIMPENAKKNIILVGEALKLSPTRTHLYYGLGRSYLVEGEADKAIQAFRTAVELSPIVPDSHYNYIAALVSIGRVQDALDHFAIAPKSLGREFSAIEHIRISEIFESGKQTDKALELILLAEKRYPENTIVLQSLIKYYIEHNNQSAALAAAERLVEVDPSFAADLEAFRNSLHEQNLIFEVE